MRLFVAIFIAFFTLPLLAFTTVTTQISDLDVSHKADEDTLVFLSGGQVAKISSLDSQLLERLREALTSNTWLEMTLGPDRHIISFHSIAAPITAMPEQHFLKGLPSYVPSVISSPEEALRYFLEGRKTQKESQCYNRAHIWSYEWRAKANLYTSKMWLFFTRKYIRKFNFEWWFHVAPYFHVLDGGRVWERVADVKYARTPLKLKQWTDIFLRNDADCPVVNSYSEWANFPESGWCYVMKSSMYYYQPLDLEVLEKDGSERHVWNPSEIRHAYKEAFDLDI